MQKIAIVLITWAETDERLEVLKRSFMSMKKCTNIPHTLVVIDNGPKKQTEFLESQNIDIHIKCPVNIGVGAARNLGISKIDSEYIICVDNDLLYFPGWLANCVHTLEKFPRWPLFVTPYQSKPMMRPKHHVGNIGDFRIFNRCAGGCILMRRTDYEYIGPWAEHSTPGGDYWHRARKLGYLCLWHPSWQIKHLCPKASYNHKHVLVNGIWTPKSELKESSNG